MDTLRAEDLHNWGAWPQGLPLTAANARLAASQGLDIVWAACHLMTQAQRDAFVIWTLQQRHPWLVRLLDRAALPEHAAAIAALTWDDLAHAQSVLSAAGDAAWDAAAQADGADVWSAAGAAKDVAGADAWAAAEVSKAPAWAAAGAAKDAAWAAGAAGAAGATARARARITAWAAAGAALAARAAGDGMAVAHSAQVEECIRLLGLE